MKKEKVMSVERSRFCHRAYLGFVWGWGLLTVLLVAYGAFAVLAALIPAEDLSMGLTDTGMKIGLSSLPINLGRGIPYWAIPRSGDLTSAANWIWFWNILCVMLWEILPIWLLLYWGKGFFSECTPAVYVEQRQEEAEGLEDGPSAIGVIGWEVMERIWNRKNSRRLGRAGCMLLAVGLCKRTVWLLTLSLGVYGTWDFSWNQDMIEFTTCAVGILFLLLAGFWKKQEPQERLYVKRVSEPKPEE